MSNQANEPNYDAAIDGERLRPLYVDLDGSLSTTDTLWEGIARLGRTHPAIFLKIIAAAPRGRPAIKDAVAAVTGDYATTLPLNEEVLAYLTEEKASRPIVLATAAAGRIADKIAERTGLFDAVLASDENTNLKGHTKLRAIEADVAERTGGTDFDYIGDSPADRPIWKRAGRAIVVASSEARAKELAAGVTIEKRIDCPKGGLRDMVKAMRVHQWVKNVLVFVPLMLSHQFLNPPAVIATIGVLIAMSLCASATYLWNDILDLEADRGHRTKKNRPIAAGRLPIARAFALSFGLMALALGLAYIVGSWMLLAALLGYVALTLLYSFVLKRKLLVDAIALGGLFSYRVFLGGVATGIVVSDWLIAFCIFFFLGLALAKRYIEIDFSKANPTERIAGRGYRPEDRHVVLTIGVTVSYISIIILSLYTTSNDVLILYSRPVFLWGVGLALIYWIGRVWVLAHRRELNEDPIVFAVKDRNSYICALFCGLSFLAAGPL